MKFTSTFFLVLVQALLPLAMAAADAPQCIQVCCDAIVPGVAPPSNVGINCSPDSTGDCFFGGQVNGCCARIAPNGARSGTGIGCSTF